MSIPIPKGSPTAMCPNCGRRQGWDGHPYAPCRPHVSTTILRDRLTRQGFARPVRIVHQYVTTSGEPDRVRVTIAYPPEHQRAGQVIRERWFTLDVESTTE